MRSEQYDILVVDDEAEDRMIMGEAFAELGFAERVTMYDSGFAFHKDLRELRELTPLPFLIVLDYNLPVADGAVILSLLMNDAVLHTIPIVMYAASMTHTQELDCLAKGAIRCIEKGEAYGDLLSFCRRVCDEAFKNPASK